MKQVIIRTLRTGIQTLTASGIVDFATLGDFKAALLTTGLSMLVCFGMNALEYLESKDKERQAKNGNDNR